MDASNTDVGGEALTGSYPKFNRNPPHPGGRFSFRRPYPAPSVWPFAEYGITVDSGGYEAMSASRSP